MAAPTKPPRRKNTTWPLPGGGAGRPLASVAGAAAAAGGAAAGGAGGRGGALDVGPKLCVGVGPGGDAPLAPRDEQGDRRTDGRDHADGRGDHHGGVAVVVAGHAELQRSQGDTHAAVVDEARRED